MNTIVIKNQTLNQEKINKAIPVRKIRIIVSDPYATESSSDEDDYRSAGKNSSPKRRRIVHEIILPNDDGGEKLEGSGEMREANSNRFRGVRRRKSGRWSAEICDPSEEAKKIEFCERREAQSVDEDAEKSSGEAYEAKKTEFSERQEAQPSSVDDAGEKLSREEGSGGTIRNDLKRFRELRRRQKSGNDSGKKSSGEASYEIKKVEFSERQEAQSSSVDEAGGKSSGEGSGGPIRTDLKKFRGVRLRRGSSWSAEIRDPFKKKKVFLGTFGTAEEASRAFETKKVEFRQRQEAQSAIESRFWGVRQEAQSAMDSSRFRGERQEAQSDMNSSRFQGACGRKRGRWTAEICDPFKKRRVFLGSFGTAEEASSVFEAKKVEFRERQDAQFAMDRARLVCGSGSDSSDQSGEQIEAGMILGSILIDNNGFLLGEFSNLDDDLKILD